MPIYNNNKAMSNCKVGSKQVAKITLGTKTIWENWTGPYSETKTDDYGSTYRTTASVSWSFASPGVKLVSAWTEGSNKNKEQNVSKIRISTSDGKYNNTLVANSGASDFDSYTSFSKETENVTYIWCANENTVNIKKCIGGIKYYKRGS